MKKATNTILFLFALFALQPVIAEETIKLAFIDGLSGPFADMGTASLHQFRYAVERANAQGGVLGGRKLEVIPFDSRGSTRTTQRRLREAIQQGARIVLQGNSSHVANELTNAIARYNESNPADPVLFLNFSAADPALTNENCNFWHFRFDPHADMKVASLVKMLTADDSIKRVYLINQDYGFGRAVAETATRLIRQERDDIQIVASVFHPVGVVEDFEPYARQIAESDIDAVITGNWGTDFYRLVFALDKQGAVPPMFSVNGGGAPISEVIGERGNDVILLAHGGIYNPAPPTLREITVGFEQHYPNESLTTPRIITTIEFLVKALEKVGSADILRVALAMEDMEFETISGNTVRMRAEDHQLIEPVRVSAQSNVDINQPMDRQGFGMKEVFKVDGAYIETFPNSCNMVRPEGSRFASN
jgi:branched-chain amino acid transport system substrate-binding protein